MSARDEKEKTSQPPRKAVVCFQLSVFSCLFSVVCFQLSVFSCQSVVGNQEWKVRRISARADHACQARKKQSQRPYPLSNQTPRGALTNSKAWPTRPLGKSAPTFDQQRAALCQEARVFWPS